MNKANEDEARRMLQDGQDIEAVVFLLKQRSCSKIDSMKIIAQILSIPIREAKMIVHMSKAWQTERALDEAFIETTIETLDEVAQHLPSKTES